MLGVRVPDAGLPGERERGQHNRARARLPLGLLGSAAKVRPTDRGS
jgi:hypothetical protein